MAEEVKWTDEQKQAIYEKDSNILVAAAAGSGKTAVLVERIINKIINEKIDIDRLLVVTFTNAAASEMRERVLKAIYKKIDENPEDERLQRQVTLLNKASICTIDSFCLDVVRNNFFEIDISQNFRIADTTEIEILQQDVLEELFEEKYESKDENFKKLINTYTTTNLLQARNRILANQVSYSQFEINILFPSIRLNQIRFAVLVVTHGQYLVIRNRKHSLCRRKHRGCRKFRNILLFVIDISAQL